MLYRSRALVVLALWTCLVTPVLGQEAEPSAPAADQAEQQEPGEAAAEPAASAPSGRSSRYDLSPVLLVTEGLDEALAQQLRVRLSEALARDVLPLVDPRARRAHASIWLSLGQDVMVLRVTPPQRPEVWRQVPRGELGSDAVHVIVKAVLEMLWADAFARLDLNEVQDPFCPSGMICIDPRRNATWPPRPEVEVLDPWDPPYQRYYWERGYAQPGGPMNPWAPPYVSTPRREAAASPAWTAPPMQLEPPKRQHIALGLLAGGGVHTGGAFLRYEVNLLRRFSRFDFGLTYVAARGQPEPFQKARRAALAMLQRRFVSQEFELDLGVSFGMFVATHESESAEVRPYLRGLLTFALPVSHSFDLLVQSELGTTFASVKDTGLVEYALTAGLRHKF